jgi:hypothetical protein
VLVLRLLLLLVLVLVLLLLLTVLLLLLTVLCCCCCCCWHRLVQGMTLAEVKGLDLGGRAGLRVPTLQEFMEACLRCGIQRPLVVEVKVLLTDGGRAQLLHLLRYTAPAPCPRGVLPNELISSRRVWCVFRVAAVAWRLQRAAVSGLLQQHLRETRGEKQGLTRVGAKCTETLKGMWGDSSKA